MKKGIIFPLIISLLYLIVNYVYINSFNLHEDAYIMFRYVELFLGGNGITYYPGGEPTEGATDFLWFIFLSFLGYLNLDIGIASILLNAAGVFMISFCMTDIILGTRNKKITYLLFPFIFLWILSSPFLAALGGFSVFLYCGFIVLTLHLLNKKTQIVWIPILSILIALFRPDGVILGVCFTLIGLYLCKKEDRKKYVTNMGLAILIGCTYFIWRYTYFGELLPLPLYVKKSGNIWLSIKQNTLGLSNITILLEFILFLICFFFQKKANRKNIFILALPLMIFFGVFSLVHQSQNIAARFQAPVMYMLYYLILVMMIDIIKEYKKYYFWMFGFYLQIGISAIIMFGFIYIFCSMDRESYVNVFPKKLAKNIMEDGDIIALTEAGRLAYWMENKPVKIIDLVGLNTKYTAKNKLTEDYISELNPDIIMAFISNPDHKRDKNVYWIEDKESIRKIIPNQVIAEDELSKEEQAMVVTGNYLLNHWDTYDVFFVRFFNYGYPHVYAIKKSKNKSELLYRLLNESFSDIKSYLELKRER